MDISTATPVEIDTELVRLYGEIAKHNAIMERANALIERIDAVEPGSYDSYHYTPEKRAAAVKQAEQAEAAVRDLSAEARELGVEYVRRGGWTRAFLVINSNGHVHRSQVCSTTFPTTSFHWVTEFSGHDEAEIVEAAGERACTVCYPSAPVDVLKRPTRIFTPDELDKQRARAEREAAKAAREAAQIVVENWQDGTRFKARVFKTERALTNALAEALSSLTWYGEGHPTAVEWLWNVEQGRKALPSWDYDKALANARKKTTREGGQPKY